MRTCRVLLFAFFVVLGTAVRAGDTGPLPSWNDGAAKAAILDFVADATNPASPSFIPAEKRVATFDNDGTLWSEQPMYFQVMFIVDRVAAMAPDHPEWRTTAPFDAILSGDRAALASIGEEGVAALVAATHGGMTTDEFAGIVASWLATARHPRFDRPYTDLVYQPMLELLDHLRANGFKTFIVSGGGVEFIRVWAEAAYGIPPEQVIGSSGETRFALVDGLPVIEKLPGIAFVDDGPGKPVGISRYIGRRPVFAAGNSDGDLEMLQYTTIADGPRLGLIVHHTDAEREWAYDHPSPVGKLDRALAQAPERGWLVVDMQRDWRVIYPFER